MTRLRDLVSRSAPRGPALPRWVESILSAGIVSTDPDVVRRQRCVNVTMYAIMGNALSHLVMNSLHNFTGFFVVNIFNLFMIVAPPVVLQLHRLGENAAAITMGIIVLLVHTCVVWALGLESELQVYFTLSPAVMLLLVGVQHWRVALVFFGLFLAALLLTLNFAPTEGWILPEDWEFRDILSSQAMINTMAINIAVLFYALTALKRAENELAFQHERSEALIQTVMPAPIAERLKSGEEHIADRIEVLSVMFADLAGFTEAAHGIPPESVVEFLDALVRACDALCEKHGVDKIKTIGDSYMAAAGFDGRSTEGAAAIGRLALALLEEASRMPALGGHTLRLRIGIHCGPATAGVIGDTRFSYDVWGDAVNTASRMESYGVPGRIHVSEAFCKLAASEFTFEERGATDMKGIGENRTFFLTGPRAAP
jgi:adenylate cyclase